MNITREAKDGARITLLNSESQRMLYFPRVYRKDGVDLWLYNGTLTRRTVSADDPPDANRVIGRIPFYVGAFDYAKGKWVVTEGGDQRCGARDRETMLAKFTEMIAAAVAEELRKNSKTD